MPISNDTIRTVGSSVAIVTGLVGLIWYIAGLDSRLRRLEGQVHTLTVAPMIAGATGQSVAGPNPMAEACANLAKRTAEAINEGRGSYTVSNLKDLMHNLGCGSTVR